MRGTPCTWPRRGELGQEQMGPGLPAGLQRSPAGPLASSSMPSSGLGRCGDQAGDNAVPRGHPGRREEPATDAVSSQCPAPTVLLAYLTVGPWDRFSCGALGRILQGSHVPASLIPFLLTPAAEYGALVQTHSTELGAQRRLAAPPRRRAQPPGHLPTFRSCPPEQMLALDSWVRSQAPEAGSECPSLSAEGHPVAGLGPRHSWPRRRKLGQRPRGEGRTAAGVQGGIPFCAPQGGPREWGSR